ncbi:MAG: hypothetical protein KBF12_02535 [Sebaldella sp.]|nr:hypothetical protein [Sebaldella sp.]
MKKLLFLFFLLLVISCENKKDEINVRSGITNTEAAGSAEIKNEDVNNFWKLYSKSEKNLLSSFNEGDKYQNKDIAALNEELKKIDESLEIEIKPNTKEKRVLTITANGIPELFPAVIKIAKMAPKDRVWNIEALRQRAELPIQIEYKDSILDSNDTEFSYEVRDNKKIDLKVYYPNNAEDNLVITYIFLDGIIGEYDTAKYISGLELINSKDSNNKYYSLNDLRKVVDELKNDPKK